MGSNFRIAARALGFQGIGNRSGPPDWRHALRVKEEKTRTGTSLPKRRSECQYRRPEVASLSLNSTGPVGTRVAVGCAECRLCVYSRVASCHPTTHFSLGHHVIARRFSETVIATAAHMTRGSSLGLNFLL